MRAIYSVPINPAAASAAPMPAPIPLPGSDHPGPTWGFCEVLSAGPAWTIRRLHVHPHMAVPWPQLCDRAEQWTALSGVATIQQDADASVLATGGSVRLGAGVVVWLWNRHDVDLDLLQVRYVDAVVPVAP